MALTDNIFRKFGYEFDPIHEGLNGVVAFMIIG